MLVLDATVVNVALPSIATDLSFGPAALSWVLNKVALDEAKPPIWRRLSLRGDLTLEQTHDYLQAAMGWTDSHLHHFEPGPRKQRWTGKHFVTAFDLEEGEEGTPEADVRLDQVLRTTGDRLFYTYDFGDDWAHTITVETMRPATDEDPDALCHRAVRACPPEDVGGIRTWPSGRSTTTCPSTSSCCSIPCSTTAPSTMARATVAT